MVKKYTNATINIALYLEKDLPGGAASYYKVVERGFYEITQKAPIFP